MTDVATKPSIDHLITLLRDGEQGFCNLAEQVEDPACKRFLLEEGSLRGLYAKELERSLDDSSGSPASHTGTSIGTIHRQWISVKSALGASDSALLGATDVCEWVQMKAYADLLRDPNLGEHLREMLSSQARSVHRAREIIDDFGVSLKRNQ